MKKTLYITMAVIGLAFIAFAVCPILTILRSSAIGELLTNDLFNNILISLGCGIITSTIVSFFLERSNWTIEKNHSRKMKENILSDLLDTVKNYNDENFDFLKIEMCFTTDLLAEISKSCELYIPMGIQFYDAPELKALKNLYFSSKSLLELMQQEESLKLYTAYHDIFYEAVNWKFAHGPYGEEENIKKLCYVLNYNISTMQACKIGEIIFFYKLQNLSFTKFLSIFEYLQMPQ